MFKAIPGYDGYEVNPLGEVKSLSRVVVRSDGKDHSYPEKMIKPYLKKGKPYYQLYVKGKKICRSQSSLIKLAFG